MMNMLGAACLALTIPNTAACYHYGGAAGVIMFGYDRIVEIFDKDEMAGGWFGLKFTDPVEILAPQSTLPYRVCFAYNEL